MIGKPGTEYEQQHVAVKFPNGKSLHVCGPCYMVNSSPSIDSSLH